MVITVSWCWRIAESKWTRSPERSSFRVMTWASCDVFQRGWYVMKTELNWVDGPWPGRLAMAPRPRGHDWLLDELKSWREAGIDVVASLLTGQEESALGLESESDICRAVGCDFVSFPINDRAVPDSRVSFLEFVSLLHAQLLVGKGVAVHCRQGVGRAGMVAIAILLLSRSDPDRAIKELTARRGVPVPETPEQVRWIREFPKSVGELAPQ